MKLFCKPPSEWFELNANGCSHGNPGKSGGGGLILLLGTGTKPR